MSAKLYRSIKPLIAPRQQGSADLEKLVPERNWRALGPEATYYGAAYEVAEAGGRPFGRITATWMHGVHPELPPGPDLYVERGKPHYGRRWLTHRSDQESFLQSTAGVDAVAVGAPILYAAGYAPERSKGHVLLIPTHATAFAHSPDEKGALDCVEELRKVFERVVVLVYGECVIKGDIPRLLNRHGVEWISGAHVQDWHTLRRMRYLFEMFDYVATNAYGSHIAYAAHFGAKVIRAGKWVELREKDILTDLPALKQRCPELADWFARICSEEWIDQAVPGISVWSDQCRAEQKAWADEVIGVQNQRPARELGELLGWTAGDQIRAWLIGRSFRAWHKLVRPGESKTLRNG